MSEPYRPPGSSDRRGIGAVGKALITTLVIGVLVLVVALGFGINTLLQRQGESIANSTDPGRASEGDGRVESFQRSEGKDSDKLTSEEIFSGAEDEQLTVTVDEKTVHARRIGRWDHPNCNGLGQNDLQSVLRKHGCDYAVEQALSGEDGRHWTGNMVLAFPDGKSAKAAAKEMNPDDVVFGFEQYERFDHVGIRDVSKHFVVVSTTVYDTDEQSSSGDKVSEDAATLTGFMQADISNYFRFR